MDPNQLPKIGVIHGTLLDSATGEPLAFAAVKVIHKMSEELVTGGMTNDKGAFRVEGIAVGPNTVEFAYVGYKTKTQEVRLGRNGTTQDLGQVKLVASDQVLDQVEVTAEREFVTNAIDRKIYNPDKLILSKTGSATDILENIPSLEIDMDGNLTLRGSSAVRVMIDGRPSRFTGEDLTDLLRSMPANSIERVEVMTNPSAKYDPDGTAGMINIVLKKSALQGLNGSVNASYSGADRARAGLNLNYKKNNFNYFLNAGLSTGTTPRSSWMQRNTFMADGTHSFYQNEEGLAARNGNNIKMGVDWKPSEKHILTLQGTYANNQRPFYETSTIDWTTPSDQFTIYRNSESIGQRNNLSVDAIYDFKPKEGVEWNARLSYTEGNSGRNLNMAQDTVEGSNSVKSLYYTTTSYGDNKEFNGLLDYTRRWGKDRKLEAGLKVIDRNSLDAFSRDNMDLSTGIYSLDTIFDNQFRFREEIYAAYTNYGFKKGQWSFQGGLRAEEARITGDQITTDSLFYNRYFRIYPSAYLTYEIGRGHDVSVSYSRRVQRPRGHHMNPFIDYSDPNNLRAGNPYLLPEFSNSFEVGYSNIIPKIGQMSASVYYRDLSNLMTRTYVVDSNGIGMSRHENMNDGEDLGMEASFRGKIGKKGAFYSLSGNYYFTSINGELNGEPFTVSGTGYMVRFMSSTPLWKNGSAQVMGMYRGPRIMPTGIARPMYMVSLSVKHSLLDDRLNLTFNTRDLFNTMGWNYYQEGANFDAEGQFRWASRIFEFGLTYNFGEVQRQKRRMNDMDRSGGGDMDMM